MTKKNMRTVLFGLVALFLVMVAFWAKGYYNDTYAISDVYYTQVPLDEVNETEWLTDDKGNRMEKGKQYELVAFNSKGESRTVEFFVQGEAEDYYAPGTYIKCSTSKTRVIESGVVKEEAVAAKALELIKTSGTRLGS